MRLHLEREQILVFKFTIDFAMRLSLLITRGYRRSWHLEIFFPVSSVLCRPEQVCWHVGPGMLFEMATDSWLPGRGTNYLLCIVKWLPTGLCWWSVYLEMFFPCGCLQILAVIGMQVASVMKCITVPKIWKHHMEKDLRWKKKNNSVTSLYSAVFCIWTHWKGNKIFYWSFILIYIYSYSYYIELNSFLSL